MNLYNGVNKISIYSTRYDGLKYANTNPAGSPVWRAADGQCPSSFYQGDDGSIYWSIQH